MSDKKLTIDDILNDDTFGILDAKAKATQVKTDEDRLIDEFEEINVFLDSNHREPSQGSMSEYSLMARLKKVRNDDNIKKILKPFDRHNLLGCVEINTPTLDNVLNDNSGILDTSDDLSIFKYRHIPKEEDRAKTDFMAKRKPLGDREFAPYEKMFHKVHQEIKDGKRKIIEFKNVDNELEAGRFYFIDGVMIYLESTEVSRKNSNLRSSMINRKDGRTRTIFENGTVSNMYYRSVSKAIYNGGAKMVSELDRAEQLDAFDTTENINDEDKCSGWIYILKSKSQRPEIKDIKNLYKIGFSSTPVKERIKNAKNEATYLYDDVAIVETYQIYNLNAKKFEQLTHRVFASACLDIEFDTKDNLRVNPREWFVVPKNVIEEAIQLIVSGEIVNYRFDTKLQRLIQK
ncbi:GIY-YIG nuclease family protein [Moraxella catarrhalis]|uniref:YeeC-like protein n=1 Tax=Moraxella catarrhalis TaxID=480 RepID=A0A198UH08_MORCA|nr:GIY-YIG nuclease family protein [Moraxella catarrhalis]OAU95686.1 YeeC-like protein [Moraxella catarrhalis]OAU97437.1 YeeC-like protein [Moraxella catarrhalis]OAV04344.1 YeeC-like protein [Moraxella catarrhalis]